MATRDFKMLAEAYESVSNITSLPTSMIGGGKPVMITMDMPGAEIDHEDHNHSNESDHSEIEMARVDLHKLEEYAPKLKEIVSNMTGLEGWVASKITKAADYISSVYHWLEYQQHEGTGSECSDDDHMFNTGYEDMCSCEYASQGCKCNGCPECH